MKPPLLDYCEYLQTVYREAIMLLDDASIDCEIAEYLRRWAIVLGVLALDAFDSVTVLLANEKRRGASMLARSLVDYDVRLRYYIIQARPCIRAHKRDASINLNHLLAQVSAAKDWDNANASLLLGVIGRFDPDVVSEDAKKALADLAARNESRIGMDFSAMHAFLLKNEVKVLGLIPGAAESLEREYRNMKPNWHMQSAFLHGDQAVITDVTTYNDAGRDGPISWQSPIKGNRTIAFTAITHMIRMMRSFAMILSWVPNLEKAAEKARVLWFDTDASDNSEVSSRV